MAKSGGGAGSGRGATLTYAMQMEPATLDPAVNEAADTSDLLQNVFEGLVNLDEQNRVVPGVADKWEVGEGGRVYTFHINPKARFHKPYSRPVTAEDVKYSFDRVFLPETKATIAPNALVDILGAKEALAGKTRGVAGVQVVDPRTVRVTLEKPNGYELMELTAGIIVCREAIEKSGGKIDAQSAIGTGPYMLSEFRPNAKAVLVANPEYWGGRPKLDRIERPVVLDQQTALLNYETGRADMCQPAFSDFAAAQKKPDLAAQSKMVNAAGVDYLVMHPKALPVFANPLVRRAFAEAVDKDSIVRVAYYGLLPRADTFLAPGVLGYNPHARRIPYGPADARRLLARAGYPGGKGFPRITLVYQQQQAGTAAACGIIRDNLKQNLGVPVALQEREAGTFFADTDKQTIPFYFIGWLATDPHDYLSLLLRTGAKYNTLGYSDPKFDALCDEGDATLDPARRAAAYAKADQVAVDDVAVIPIDYRGFPFFIKPNVKDLEFNLAGLMPHYRTRIAH